MLSKISLSAVMQKALENEFYRFTQSSEDLIFAKSLQEATKNFWKEERAHLAHAAEVLVDRFLDAAVQDHDYRLFKLYVSNKRMERNDHPKMVNQAATSSDYDFGEIAADILSDFQEMIFKSLSEDNPIVSPERLAQYCEEGQAPDSKACFEWLCENHPDMWPLIDEAIEKRLDKYDVPKWMLA